MSLLEETKYLATENTWRYRSISRIIYENYEKMKYWLYKEDIYEELKNKALSSVRGTVQADILKEDQAQNTCIFSTEFSLKLKGDVQDYFIQKNVISLV